jgi:hypothetical protein
MPRVYLMDNPQPNAFATGRNPEHAAVAATTGLLNMLSREEIAGVMAHELSHIKNRDTLIMTITATIAGAISMLAQFGLFFGGNRDSNHGGLGVIGTIAMVILAPIAAMLVQMAISRNREYSADNMGARISASRPGLPRRSPRSTMPRIRSRTRRPSIIRRPRRSSSSILCRARAWTTCSRLTRRRRTASRRSSGSRRKWDRTGGAGLRQGRTAVALRAQAPGAARTDRMVPGVDISPKSIAFDRLSRLEIPRLASTPGSESGGVEARRPIVPTPFLIER